MEPMAASPAASERWPRRVSANVTWALLSLPMVVTLALVFAIPIGFFIVLSFFSMTGPPDA